MIISSEIFPERTRHTKKSTLQGNDFPVLRNPKTRSFRGRDIPAFSCSFVEFCAGWDSGRTAVCLGREGSECEEDCLMTYLMSSPAPNTHPHKLWTRQRYKTLFPDWMFYHQFNRKQTSQTILLGSIYFWGIYWPVGSSFLSNRLWPALCISPVQH